MTISQQQITDMTEDRRSFQEFYDVLFVTNIYESANFFVEVFDKFGRHTKTLYGNVFPKVGEPFGDYEVSIVAQGLTQFLYDMSCIHRSASTKTVVYPWAGLHVQDILRYVRGELSFISVANGVVITDEKTTPIRLPVAAKPLLMGRELLELRALFKEVYRPHMLSQFLERWKDNIVDCCNVPKTQEDLLGALEHLAALHNRSFEYGPEGVGISYVIGGNVKVKYHKPKKAVLIEDAYGGVVELDLGSDVVGVVLEAITGAPDTGLMGIHESKGYAALEDLKERLAYCPDDRMQSYVRHGSEFVVNRRDRTNHTGKLVTAKDQYDQTYLIFVMEKDKAVVRCELHTADLSEVGKFYDVITGYMDVNK
jgi:hypothetical protein